MSSNPSNSSTVFVGSSNNLQAAAASSIADPLIADGDVGLYGHMSGIITANQQGYENAIISKWSGTGAGLVELGYDEPMALMNVTIFNSTTKPITIPIGQIVSSKSGVEYQIVQKPRQEDGWSNTDTGVGTAGYYTIQPGQSLTLLTQAVADGPSGNLADNQVTQISVPGATITGSSLFWYAPEWAVGTVTLTNTTSSVQIVWERMTVTGSNGTYQIAVDKTIASFVATDADGSSGYYVIKPGATLTLPISAANGITATTVSGYLLQEQAQVANAGSITGTGTLPTGVAITGSSALTISGINDPSNIAVTSELGTQSGFLTNAVSSYFTSDVGYNPTEANVNSWNVNVWTATDLANWESYVDNARAVGYLNLAPMMSEYETVDFATADATKYIRAGALYGGGITFDMPPGFFLAREEAYRQSTVAEIKWATANGLRSSITLSPDGADDQLFLTHTKEMIAYLIAAGGLPTQFVVKDGGVTGSSIIFSTTDPNSLNSIAQYLSQLQLSPSNSESGLEVQGTTSRPDELMTGVSPTVTVVGSAPVTLFQLAEAFATSKTNITTLTVSLGNSKAGSLADGAGLGVVSTDGSSFTVSGDMATVSSALSTLQFIANQNFSGSASLAITLVDNAGTVTASTSLSVDNSLSIGGLPATENSNGQISPNGSVQIGYANIGESVTVTLTLSNPSLSSFWDFGAGTLSSDGKTLTFSSSAAGIQTFLRGISLVSAVGSSGVEVETITISDGVQSTSSSTAIATSATTGIAISNLLSADAIPSGNSDHPFCNILLTNSSTSTLMQATLSLPKGSASFVAGTYGLVSADGLTYTVKGTATQLQTSLRTLTVDVAANAQQASEGMQINISGHVTTMSLQTGGIGTPQSVVSGSPQAISVVGSSPVGLYAGTQIAGSGIVANTTATISLTDTSLGRLVNNGYGSVSSDGSTITITGSAADITSALSHIQLVPSSLASGSAQIALTIASANSKSTVETNLTVHDTPVNAKLSSLPGQSNMLAGGISISSSNGALLEASTGGQVTNGVFSVSGSATSISSALTGLIVTAGNANPANLVESIIGSGFSFVDSGLGNDTIVSSGRNVIYTGSATTTIQAGGWDTISAGSGSVSASSSKSFVFLGGTSGADTITAGGGDIRAGTGGGSTLIGQKGLIGLTAGGMNDTLIGGGASVMTAAAGKATCIKLSSGDTAIGSDGASISGPSSGSANIFLLSGKETVTGGGGSMVIRNTAGDNYISLGTGKSSVYGYTGVDHIGVSAKSNVQVFHGSGQEFVSLIYGNSSGSSVYLANFNSTNDRVTLSGYSTKDIQGAISGETLSSSGVTIKLSDGASITFGGVSHLSTSDFTYS